MKRILILTSFFLLMGYTTNYASNNNSNTIIGKKKITFIVSEENAEIFINNNRVGVGQADITVPSENCIYVVVKLEGFITEKIKFCNKKETEKLPKTYNLQLKIDDAYEATNVVNDINEYFVVESKSLSKDEAWIIINQIILDYVDDIEMIDKETGYLRTAWAVKSFTQNTIRTRIIVKETKSTPLTFKIKIVSEKSGQALTNAKNDILFTSWNRLLKNFSGISEEFINRLK